MLAWTTPVVWVLVAVFAGPSDGTAISPPTAFAGEQRWGESVTVVRSYGETPLRKDDQILAVEGGASSNGSRTRPRSSVLSATT